MLSFQKHIESLLIRHDYVVIPGFGGFALQSGHASIQGNSILPPAQLITFNPLLKHSDGLLAIEISRKEDLSYRKAVELIEDEIKSFQSELSKSKTIRFGTFGTFFRSESGNLIFHPVNFAAFIPANTGFQPEQVRELQHQKEVITVRFERKKLIRYAAAIALVIGLLFVAPQLNDVRYQHSAGLIPENFDTVFHQDTIQQNVVVPDKCPELVKDTVDSVVVVTNNAELYHVIVACLGSKDKAEQFCEELVNSGYDCAHVLDPDNTYRISIQSFKDKDVAIAYMESLRQTDKRFDSAWVLCK